MYERALGEARGGVDYCTDKGFVWYVRYVGCCSVVTVDALGCAMRWGFPFDLTKA